MEPSISPSACINRSKNYKKTPPTWKEEYRKRCADRMKMSRSKLLEKFRGSSGAVKSVLDEEWDNYVAENRSLVDDVFGYDLSARELELEQSEMIDSFVAYLTNDDDSRLVEEYSRCADRLADVEADTNQFPCPVCKMSPLSLYDGVLSCYHCQLSLPCQISFDQLQQTLSCLYSNHVTECSGVITFAHLQQGLAASCINCDLFTFVL